MFSVSTDKMDCCDICADTFTSSARREVECFRCHKKVCRKCVERFLIESIQDPHCMFPDCGVAWDRMFLGEVMTGSFMTKDFARHREKVLFERERSFLPDAMRFVELQNEADTIQDQLREIKVMMKRLRDRQHELHRRSYRVQQTMHDMHNGIRTDLHEGGSNYRRPCVGDGCHGLINSHTGLCASCRRHTCTTCNVLLPEDDTQRKEHVCSQDDVAQWTEIRKSTRPCPGCSTRIMKASGCDQMWCPQCHTAFRWSTGTIERGPIHNPHYYEWMFSGAAPAAAPVVDHCNDNLPGPSMIRTRLNRRDEEGNNDLDAKISVIHRTVIHYRATTRTDEDSRRIQESKRLTLRVDFLRNRLDEAKFRNRLQRIDKEASKHAEYRTVINTFVMMMTDLFRRFCAPDPVMTKQDFVNSTKRAFEITSDAVKTINKRYKSNLSSPSMQ